MVIDPSMACLFCADYKTFCVKRQYSLHCSEYKLTDDAKEGTYEKAFYRLGKEEPMETGEEKKKTAAINRRVFITHTVEIHAPAARIFPLLCPVAEYDWISGWDCRIGFTASGVNEEGCIFMEQIMGPVLVGSPVASTWVTTVHDERNRHIRFVIFVHDQAVVRYDVRLEEQEGSKTRLAMNFEITAVSEEFGSLDDEEIRGRIMVPVTFISGSLKHYCETGKMLKAM